MENSKKLSIGIAVISAADREHIEHSIPPLIDSHLEPKVLLINTSSNDGTVEEAENLGVETITIPKSHFNHGSTREMARSVLDTDIVIYMTPRTYILDHEVLPALIAPLLKGEAAVSYGRQISHKDADFFARFVQDFNFPTKSHIRSIKDVSKYGPYTFFCSNHFAAYRNDVLDKIGGIPSTLSAEDICTTAKILIKGYKIAYVAEAMVKQSQNHTIEDEFRFHFDQGYVRRENHSILKYAGLHEIRKKHYSLKLIGAVAKEEPLLLPFACAYIASQWLGFIMGQASHQAPLWLRKFMSSQEEYWTSDDFIKTLKKNA